MTMPATNASYEYEIVRERLLAGIDDMVRNGRKLVLGEELERTEKALAEYTGRKYAIGVGSGTDAIYIALKALGVRPNDEVLLPANICVAVLETVLRNNAIPRFVDVRPDTWTLDPSKALNSVNKRTRAILAVHAYGLPSDLDDLLAVAGDKLHVIECCGQAFGARYKSYPVGSFGIAGCFSFNPSKVNGAMGDGGAIVTDDEEVARIAHRMRDHGRDREGEPAHFVGVSSRLDEINALAVRLKLDHVDEWIALRHQKALLYRQMLSPARGVTLQSLPRDRVSSYQMFTVRVPSRDKVRKRMIEQGVRAGTSYKLPFRMPGYLKYAGGGIDSIPETYRLEATTLSLPFFTGITDEYMHTVTDALISACQE